MEEVKDMKFLKTPAVEYLFKVNPKRKNMDAKKADLFHTKIAKALFLWKEEMPDIQPTVTS